MKNQETISMLCEALSAQPGNTNLRNHIIGLALEDNETSNLNSLLANISKKDHAELIATATPWQSQSPEAILVLADAILRDDKANAQAYLLKTHAYLTLKQSDEAKKYYGIATVIDESLESPELEQMLQSLGASTSNEWSGGETSAPKPGLSSQASQPEAIPLSHSHPSEDEDAFVETDPALDALLNAEMTDFSQIGGMEALKEKIRMSIIYPFKNQELFAKFKKKVGGGILLYGPPGCGKTLISKATAGECGAHFINICIHEILSKWIGESEQRIHQMFETARRKSPTIIFIDEVDALCVKRSDAGHTASLVNALLTEIDGATSDNNNVLVIGATNTPWRIDSAFRRPGRFDHVMFVPPPDEEARKSIFEIALNNIPQESIRIDRLAKMSKQFSGADIKAVVETSAEQVIERIMKTGKEMPISEKIVLAAIKKHRPTTLEWMEQASNYASYANQSGLYDELAEYIRTGK